MPPEASEPTVKTETAKIATLDHDRISPPVDDFASEVDESVVQDGQLLDLLSAEPVTLTEERALREVSRVRYHRQI
jgi:hypothetical protein